MTAKELREKTDTELTELVREKREELRKIRFGTAGATMRNTRAGTVLRRDVARILTELTSRSATRA